MNKETKIHLVTEQLWLHSKSSQKTCFAHRKIKIRFRTLLLQVSNFQICTSWIQNRRKAQQNKIYIAGTLARKIHIIRYRLTRKSCFTSRKSSLVERLHRQVGSKSWNRVHLPDKNLNLQRSSQQTYKIVTRIQICLGHKLYSISNPVTSTKPGTSDDNFADFNHVYIHKAWRNIENFYLKRT